MKMLVNELMSEDIFIVKSDLIIKDVINGLATYDNKCAFVVNSEGNFVGLFDETCISNYCINADFLTANVERYMIKSSVALNRFQRIDLLEVKFIDTPYKFFPVLEEKTPVGVVILSDLYNFWSSYLYEQNQNIIFNCNKALSAVIHDLRNPVDAIQSINELILSKNISTSEYLESNFPNIVDESCKTISHLIDDLLDLNCIKGGRIGVKKEVINVVPVLETVIKTFIPKARAKNIGVDFEAETSVILFADQRRLSQVFQNLISNSIKYSLPNSKIRVLLKSIDKNVEISFIDHGQGIKGVELHKVFDEFCKISSIPTGNEPSTGLGLSIVKKLVEAHEGTVSVKSEPFKNTCFTVKLPIVHQQKSA